MAHYIDKAAVVAEINRVLNSYDPNEITSGRYALASLRDFIDTFEVKEVNLDKEFDSFAYTLPRSAIGDGPFDKHFDDPKIIEARNHGWRHSWSYKEALKIAKHFFELGIKAQKGEKI